MLRYERDEILDLEAIARAEERAEERWASGEPDPVPPPSGPVPAWTPDPLEDLGF